jgi:hypothetical protein
MRTKANTLMLVLLLALTPSLLADDHGRKNKRGEGRGDGGEHRGRIEERVRIERDDDHDRVKIERRVRVRDNDDDERRLVVRANRVVIINNDVNRLESILVTAQGTPVIFTRPTLVSVGNEAIVLADRLVVNTSALRRANALSAARLLRKHVRQLRAAAARGDATAVRLHAREALPLVVRIDGMV